MASRLVSPRKLCMCNRQHSSCVHSRHAMLEDPAPQSVPGAPLWMRSQRNENFRAARRSSTRAHAARLERVRAASVSAATGRCVACLYYVVCPARARTVAQKEQSRSPRPCATTPAYDGASRDRLDRSSLSRQGDGYDQSGLAIEDVCNDNQAECWHQHPDHACHVYASHQDQPDVTRIANCVVFRLSCCFQIDPKRHAMLALIDRRTCAAPAGALESASGQQVLTDRRLLRPSCSSIVEPTCSHNSR